MSGTAIVVVNYASSALIAGNLPSHLVAAAQAQVVIVDNESSAAERDAVRVLAHERGWALVERPNDGFAAGCNAGVDEAERLGCDVVILLNPDARCTAEVLRGLADDCREHPDALVAPLIRDSAGALVFAGSTIDVADGHLRRGWLAGGRAGTRRNWLTAACLAMTTDAYRRCGGMDESYFLYWEDVDLSMRALDAGLALRLRTDLEAIHDEGGTQGRTAEAKSDRYYFYNARNRLRFARRHLSPQQQRSWARSTPRETLAIWMRGGRRQLLTHPQGFLAAARGAVAGLRRAQETEPNAAVVLAHPSPDLYGSDRVFLETVSAFVDAGYRTVVTLPGDGPLVAELEARGGEVRACPSPVLRKSTLRPARFAGLVLDAVRALPLQLRLLSDVRPARLVVNTITIPEWLLAGRLARVRSVCHVHEAEISLPRPLRRLLYTPMWLADRLVVNSRFTRDAVASAWAGLGGRSDIVYNGVPSPTAEPALPPERLTRPRLLFVGRISPRKGPAVAVRALALLRESGLDASLTILGDVFPGYEWFSDELDTHIDESGMGEWVRRLGFADDIWPVLAEHDIMLVPAIGEESFGNTAVEAMLACRPAVVSAMSGLLEAADGYGSVRWSEPDDAGSVAAGVREILRDWPVIRAGLRDDRARALERHAPTAYRGTVVETVMSTKGVKKK